MPCPHIETCELFPELTLNSALKVWQVFYCEGDYSQCMRHQRSKKGKPVPITLLPNGKSMDQSMLSKKATAAAKKQQAQPSANSETLDLDSELRERVIEAPKEVTPAAQAATGQDLQSTFYLRIKAKSGAASELEKQAKKVLSEFSIHVDAVIRKRHDSVGEWLVLITDEAPEMTVYRAILRIEELPVVASKVKCISLEKLAQLVAA